LFLDKLTLFHSEVDGCKPLQTPRVALELGKHAESNTLTGSYSIASSTMVAVNPSGKKYLKAEAGRWNYFDAARVASMSSRVDWR
jgi:hypothetical protein